MDPNSQPTKVISWRVIAYDETGRVVYNKPLPQPMTQDAAEEQANLLAIDNLWESHIIKPV